MWFISKRLHRQMLKAKERDIQELTNKVEKLEGFLEEEKDNNKYLKTRNDYMQTKYIFEVKKNVKMIKNNVDAEKLINKIEFMIKDKKIINEKMTMQIKKLVKDYHTQN